MGADFALGLFADAGQGNRVVHRVGYVLGSTCRFILTVAVEAAKRRLQPLCTQDMTHHLE